MLARLIVRGAPRRNSTAKRSNILGMRHIRTWQLCRTGVHGADGAQITEADLNEIMETFTPPRPVTIGHDMASGDAAPKYGDVIYLDGIYADPKYPGEKVLVGSVVLHPELDTLYGESGEASAYTGWSVTIPRRASDGKRYLHSLAVCGAVPPKIPGLKELTGLTSNTHDTIHYNDSIIYQEAIPMTEEDKKKIEELEAQKEELEKKLKALEEEKKAAEDKTKKETEPEFSDPAQTEAMKALQERLTASEKLLKESRLERFCDAVNTAIPAGLREKTRAVAAALMDSSSVSFSDNGTEKNGAPLELLKDILCAWPSVETRQVYSFSDSETDDKNKQNDWAAVAAKL